MKPIHYILTAGLLFIASQIFGQLTTTLTPATVTAPIGSTVSLQLKVTNFTNVNSMQFPITYNSTILEFDTIDNVALPNFTSGNYNATTGKIALSWFPDAGAFPNGFTVPANYGLTLIQLDVQSIGNAANPERPEVGGFFLKKR